MKTRRSFLRSLIAAVALAPTLCRFKSEPIQIEGIEWERGFFRAVFAEASKPVNPEYGFVILHQRCGFKL